MQNFAAARAASPADDLAVEPCRARPRPTTTLQVQRMYNPSLEI